MDREKREKNDRMEGLHFYMHAVAARVAAPASIWGGGQDKILVGQKLKIKICKKNLFFDNDMMKLSKLFFEIIFGENWEWLIRSGFFFLSLSQRWVQPFYFRTLCMLHTPKQYATYLTTLALLPLRGISGSIDKRTVRNSISSIGLPELSDDRMLNVQEAQLIWRGSRQSETCGTEEHGHQRSFTVRSLSRKLLCCPHMKWIRGFIFFPNQIFKKHPKSTKFQCIFHNFLTKTPIWTKLGISWSQFFFSFNFNFQLYLGSVGESNTIFFFLALFTQPIAWHYCNRIIYNPIAMESLTSIWRILNFIFTNLHAITSVIKCPGARGNLNNSNLPSQCIHVSLSLLLS